MRYPSSVGETPGYPEDSGLRTKGSSFQGKNLYLVSSVLPLTKYKFSPQNWNLFFEVQNLLDKLEFIHPKKDIVCPVHCKQSQEKMWNHV